MSLCTKTWEWRLIFDFKLRRIYLKMLGQIENLLWERYKSITVGIKKHKERWISTVQLALKLFPSQRTFSNNIWFRWREYRNNCSHQVRGGHKYLSVWAPVWCKVFKNLVKKHNVVHIIAIAIVHIAITMITARTKPKVSKDLTKKKGLN